MGSPHKGPVMWPWPCTKHICLNKRLIKQSWGWWFETPLRPLWRHCNVIFTPRCVLHHIFFLQIQSSCITHESDKIPVIPMEVFGYYWINNNTEFLSCQITLIKVSQTKSLWKILSVCCCMWSQCSWANKFGTETWIKHVLTPCVLLDMWLLCQWKHTYQVEGSICLDRSNEQSWHATHFSLCHYSDVTWVS